MVNCPNLTELRLYSSEIGDKEVKALTKAINRGNCPKLTKVEVSGNNVSYEAQKNLRKALKNNNERLKTNMSINSNFYRKGSNSSRCCTVISIVAGGILGMGVAYFAGASKLTPLGSVIAVFAAAALIGALIGYGVTKIYEKVSHECSSVNSNISGTSATGHSEGLGFN